MSREEMLGAFSTAHDNLLIAADAVTQGDLLEAPWGLREILAHVAAWEAEGMRRIPLLDGGADGVGYDIDAFNAAVAASVADQSLGQVRATLLDTHERLLSMLDDLDEAAFAPHGAAYEWVAALTAHSNEHASELRR